MAQTAAFSGADVLLRGALAVAAASGSYAVFSKKGGSSKTSAIAERAAPAVTESTLAEAELAEMRAELAEMRAELAEAQAKLKAESDKNEKLETQNAEPARAVEETVAATFAESDPISSSDAGERASELVESLEHQIEALQLRLEEEKANGGYKLEDASSRAAQLADQLQATQRAANKLSCELESYRRKAHDFDAKQALTNLQLKAAREKIETLEKKVRESDAKTETRVKEKTSRITELENTLKRMTSARKALEERLEETETRLEMEVAGSLAAAKKKALAMLDAYDVSPMTAEGDSERNGEKLRENAEFPQPPGGSGVFPGAPSETRRSEAPGEWLQAYDVERQIHYWYNNITMETVWELPEGARVHDSVVDRIAGDDDLPKHFEGPSGLNSR